jgi:hypothetical protein
MREVERHRNRGNYKGENDEEGAHITGNPGNQAFLTGPEDSLLETKKAVTGHPDHRFEIQNRSD